MISCSRKISQKLNRHSVAPVFCQHFLKNWDLAVGKDGTEEADWLRGPVFAKIIVRIRWYYNFSNQEFLMRFTICEYIKEHTAIRLN